METLKVKLTGIRPLLMHSQAMIDPDNACVRQIGELQRLLKKTKKEDVEGREKIRRQIERAEWEGSLYWTAEDGVYLPGDNIFACIVAGAKKSKCGKQVEQGLIPLSNATLETVSKTTDLEKLYANPNFSLRSAVRIPPKTGARLMKVRPMIPTGWIAQFEIEYDESVLPTRDLKDAINTGGSLIGLGDWRPKFGRFTAEFE